MEDMISVLLTYLYTVTECQVSGYVHTFWWGGSIRREHWPWLGNISVGPNRKEKQKQLVQCHQSGKTSLLVHYPSITPVPPTLANACPITICWWLLFNNILFNHLQISSSMIPYSCPLNSSVKGHAHFVLTCIHRSYWLMSGLIISFLSIYETIIREAY